MQITAEIVQAIITKVGEQPKHIAAELNRIEDINRRMWSWREDSLLLDKEYKDTKAKLEAIRKEIQSSCPHYSTTYHEDPSGNNDSYITCAICNANVTRSNRG